MILGIAMLPVMMTVMLGPQGPAGLDVSESVVPPNRDVLLVNDCGRALSAQDGSRGAIETCLDAVTASDEAGADAYAPRSARTWLGDAYMFAKRWSDAIDAYQSALNLSRLSVADDGSDLNTGEILLKIGVAQFNLGELSPADRNVASAIEKIESSMAAHPDQRQQHAITLRVMLLFNARIKQLRRDDDAAQRLERRADALSGSN